MNNLGITVRCHRNKERKLSVGRLAFYSDVALIMTETSAQTFESKSQEAFRPYEHELRQNRFSSASKQAKQ